MAPARDLMNCAGNTTAMDFYKKLKYVRFSHAQVPFVNAPLPVSSSPFSPSQRICRFQIDPTSPSICDPEGTYLAVLYTAGDDIFPQQSFTRIRYTYEILSKKLV
jgi:hypothetical protein